MDLISIITSTTTVGASAAQLSLALFSVVQTLKDAPKEIAEIADEMSLLAGSLQTLGEIVDAHEDLCKPAFFSNTRSIISQYKRVAAEIRLLIDKRRSLVGLKWRLKKPKAKSLLKKVEGIRNALMLEINIIRLAREEINRSHAKFDSNGQTQGNPRLNRFRRIVESSVQATRLVVESAQQEDDELETDTYHDTSAELDTWESGSSDTATWLYTLVFSPDEAIPSSSYEQPRQLTEASVADERVETATKVGFSLLPGAPIPPKRRPSGPEDGALILWNKQTEPGTVADRLLSSWTTLSSSQIRHSSTCHDSIEGVEDDEWRERILKMAEEVEEDDNLSLDEWEQKYNPVGSEDEAFQRFKDVSAYSKSPAPGRDAGDTHVTFGTSPINRHRRHRSKQSRPRPNMESSPTVGFTLFWKTTVINLGSELLSTMRRAGWRTPYTRISGKGQTHYLGSQPVHIYFFDPDYEPQFGPSETGKGSAIAIQKGLVEEYALMELGFQFEINDMGSYILDDRITYNDIEALIDRSFLMRENNYRRLHRQAQPRFYKNPNIPSNAYSTTHARSVYTLPSVYSGENPTVYNDADTDSRDKKTARSADCDADESNTDEVSSIPVSPSVVSKRSPAPSPVASWSSKSRNPYRKYMNVAEDSRIDSVSRSSRSPGQFD